MAIILWGDPKALPVKTYHWTICFFLSFLYPSAFSQAQSLNAKDSIVQSFWLVTLGTNIVDDSGDEFRELFDIKEGWNMVPFPSRASLGYYFKNGVGLELVGTYNKYRSGKIIDDVPNGSDIDYYAADLRVSYDLNRIFGSTGFIDPYVGVGAGYTDANNQGRGTLNALLGFRVWFSDHWGLDLSSTGKWSMDTANTTNHIQHAIGVAYRFEMEKGLSHKGVQKLALLQEMELERQRKQDSIALAEEKARLLAEQLQQETAAKELAAEEKAKSDAEEKERRTLQNKIDNLGNVYFKFNSSYLTETDKGLLDQLVEIMTDRPGLKIKITAHTDSRGSEKYNQWLSERRAKRTRDYLISKGIAENRVGHKAFGESQPVNECRDGIYCTEEKHASNRRSEFIIMDY